MLTPPGKAPERIGIGGRDGSGKTKAWMEIADLSVRTGSPAKFHVIDTDFAVMRSMEEYPRIEEVVELHEVMEWPEYEEAADKILKETSRERGDWVVSDLHNKAWASVQDFFTEEVFGQDAGAYFLEARKAFETQDRKGKSGSSFTVFDGWVDWQVINRMYRTWAMKVLFKHRCHVFLATGAEKLQTEGKAADSKEDRMLYGDLGIKLSGQKHTGHEMHTVLIATHLTAERWTMSTVKDRSGRQYWQGEEIHKFGMDYLRKVAGWTL
jgi:hypothetical protein